jgi:hypothetical protein
MKQKENPAKAGQGTEAGRVKGHVFHKGCFTDGADSQVGFMLMALDKEARTVTHG